MGREADDKCVLPRLVQGFPGVQFVLTAAVRDPDGACVEQSNCNWERATLCAFAQTNKSATNTSFLTCMDDKAWGSPLSAAQDCASKHGLDPQLVASCYNGAEGTRLLQLSADAFNHQFPQRANVPAVFVNGVQTEASYKYVVKALCDAGAQSQACSRAHPVSCPV